VDFREDYTDTLTVAGRISLQPAVSVHHNLTFADFVSLYFVLYSASGEQERAGETKNKRRRKGYNVGKKDRNREHRKQEIKRIIVNKDPI
jgi:hypothetical protein